MIKKTLAILFIFVGIVLTIPVGIKVFFPDLITLQSTVIFHILSALFFSIGMYYGTTPPEDNGKRSNLWWSYSAALCTFLPLYGIAIAVLIYLFQRYIKKAPPPIEDDEITVQDIGVFGRVSTKSKQLELLERLDIEPFIDIFRMGHARLKKGAIQLLADIKTGTAIKILKTALMDKDMEVRLFAAGVLGRMDDEFAKLIEEKSSTYSEMKNEKSTLELFDVYIKYADSGLTEEISKNYYLQECLNLLDNLPATPKISYLKSSIDLRLNKIDDAMKSIKSALDIENDNAEYNEQLWKTLFEQKDYKELIKTIKGARDSKIEEIDQGLIEFWT
ncbi:MAG: HEAT repeat domain-containing protein [Deltaproteobacteria bacterium]|jgi:hypothetical protein|nr:HEAT repeat domain-containing protein [Deltaproteobacteria bacterium]